MLHSEIEFSQNTLRHSRMAGVRNSCVLLSDGSLYLFGSEDPTYGNNITTASIHTLPKKLQYFANIRICQISVGNQYNIFLSDDNRVFGNGSNQFGKLGDLPYNGTIIEPVEIIVQYTEEDRNSAASITKISAGIGGCTMVLTSTGRVYTCGQVNGRAADSPHNQLLPIPMETFHGDRVSDLSVGGCVNLFITASGSVYTCGYNSNAEGNHMLGHEIMPNGGNAMLIPTRIEHFTTSGIRIVSGSAGRLHCIVIDDQGRLYGWGSNRHGQLGLPGGGDHPARAIPIVMDDRGQIVTTAVGGSEDQHQSMVFTQVDCGWYHTLALNIFGEAISFGSSSYGVLGRYGEEKVLLPGKVELECNIAAVYAGDYHSLFMTTDTVYDDQSDVYGRMFASCGLGVNCQLGGGETSLVAVDVGGARVQYEARVILEMVTINDPLNPPPRPLLNANIFVGAAAAGRRVERGFDVDDQVNKRNRVDDVADRAAQIRRDFGDAVRVEEVDQGVYAAMGARGGFGAYDVHNDNSGEEDDDEDEYEEEEEEGRWDRHGYRRRDDDDDDDEDGSDDEDDEDDYHAAAPVAGNPYDNDDGADDEEEEDTAAYVTIDYGDTPLNVNNGDIPVVAAETFSTFTERLFNNADYLSAPADSLIHVIIANHYDLANLQQLTNCLCSEQCLDAVRHRLEGLTFVSCGLVVVDDDSCTAFALALSQYTQFKRFTLDLTAVYTDLQLAASGEGAEDRPQGVLAASLVQCVSTLEELYMSAFDNDAIEILCDALLNNNIDQPGGPTNALQVLAIDESRFDRYGFECLANVLATNSVLQELILSAHAKINDESVIVLAQPLTTSRTLQRLDLHVKELGHIGVQQLGIEALLQCMEGNPHCVLSDLDVSGNDGEPQISRELQTRLTKCLVNNAQRNGDKYMRYARMSVFKCHRRDD